MLFALRVLPQSVLLCTLELNENLRSVRSALLLMQVPQTLSSLCMMSTATPPLKQMLPLDCLPLALRRDQVRVPLVRPPQVLHLNPVQVQPGTHLQVQLENLLGLHRHFLLVVPPQLPLLDQVQVLLEYLLALHRPVQLMFRLLDLAQVLLVPPHQVQLVIPLQVPLLDQVQVQLVFLREGHHHFHLMVPRQNPPQDQAPVHQMVLHQDHPQAQVLVQLM